MSDYNWKEAMPMSETGKLINSGMVHEAFGYASVCWDEDGVYESGKAIIAADNLISHIGMSFEEEIQSLKEKFSQYESDNKKLRECVEFYSREAFDPLGVLTQLQNGYIRGHSIESDWEWTGKNAIGGKKARECLKELG